MGFKNTSLRINVFSPPSCLQNNVLGSLLSLGWRKEKELIISFIEIGFPWFLCYSLFSSFFLFLWKGEIRRFSLWKGEWNHSLIYLWIINNHTFPIKMDDQKPCFSCSFSNNTNISNNRFSLKNVFYTTIRFHWKGFCFE